MNSRDSDLSDINLDLINLSTDQEEEEEEREASESMPKVAFDLVRNIPHPRFRDTSKTILAVQIKLDGATDCSTLEISFDTSKNRFVLTWKEINNVMVAASQLQHIVNDRSSMFAQSYHSVMQDRLDKEYDNTKALQKSFEFSPPQGIKLDPIFIDPFTFSEVLDPFELTSTATRERLHLDANYATFFMFVHKGLNTPNAARYQRTRTFNGNNYASKSTSIPEPGSFSLPKKRAHDSTYPTSNAGAKMNANQSYFTSVGGSNGGFAGTAGNQKLNMNLPDFDDKDWGDISL